MSAPKLISEREAVLREREAFEVGARWQRLHGTGDKCRDMDAVARDAPSYYRLPMIERPRVVRDPQYSVYWFRVVNGVVEWSKNVDGRWSPVDVSTPPHCSLGIAPTAARVRMLADLLANPTELVDDDGSVSSSRPEGRASSEETT